MKPHAMCKLFFAASMTLLLLAPGCYPLRWARTEVEVMPSHFGRLQQVKIWSGDSVFRWHAVVLTNPSITGISYNLPAECDSCRRALEWSSVDSIRIGYPESPGLTVLVWIGVAGILVLGAVTR
jgi:hypothetical protein